MRFKINDKVMQNRKYDNRDAVPYGAIGTIIGFGEGAIKVLFKGIGERYCDENSLILIKEENKMTDSERDDGRSLYKVIVVNPNEDGEVILEENVIAKDEGEAKFQSSIKEVVKAKKLKVGNVDVIIKLLGPVRPYETVQKVKLIGGIDGYKVVKEEK